MWKPNLLRSVLALLSLTATPWLFAATGYAAWLRYAPLEKSTRYRYASLPERAVLIGGSPILESARAELGRGLSGMLGLKLAFASQPGDEPAIVLGAWQSLSNSFPELKDVESVAEDGFWIKTVQFKRSKCLVITGTSDRGVLYGVFALLRRVALGETLTKLNLKENPYASIRFLNHWDNLNGSIERGYAGKSIFWEQDHVIDDLAKARDYARLMASVGINGCSINNVNADARAITPAFLTQVARIADVFRPWGVRLLLSIDFSSPQKLGGLDTFDPLDARVAEFWKAKIEEVYHSVPDLAGFILKADSEGRLGPSAYHRTHADAANVIARPLKPHGGLLFYRGFVYDHHMDWRNLKLDRAKAAYDNFHELDGLFDDNVIVQIKHGPIDFQVREPPSPLFGGLRTTCEAVELQITQEYTGQQRHLCYLVPMWKQALDFDLQAKGAGTPVKSLVSGKVFHQPNGGFVAVSNVGRDTNWLAHPLAMANLYGFGRLAWNPNLSSQTIAEEWTRLTFGNDPRVVQTIVDLEMKSWPAYENYTGPLGVGTLTDIIGVHYGPAVESSERNGWGQWHRADAQGVGMDRTAATGTGFISQYSPGVAEKFESLKTCPDELLLFMHHVPYTHVLHSGKTVIQHIYDSHYDGAAQAAGFVQQWSALKGKVEEPRFSQILQRLQYQAGHSVVWRDAINNWFLKTSGIPDQKGRAGHFPQRFEAENMILNGYSAIDIKPWESASGGKAVAVSDSADHGSASLHFTGASGRYDLNIEYFDQNNGVSAFSLLIGGHEIDHWLADDTLPSSHPDGHTSTRRTVRAIPLNNGDEIKIEAIPRGGERACLDYIEIIPRSKP